MVRPGDVEHSREVEHSSEAIFRRWDEADLEDAEDYKQRVENVQKRLAGVKNWVDEHESLFSLKVPVAYSCVGKQNFHACIFK
jgi:hypothetical protein